MNLVAVRFFLGGIEQSYIVPTAWYYIHSLRQTKFFLALVLSSYGVGAVVAGPVIGYIADRSENPRFLFICCCILKAIANIVYSVNISEYFPLFGRFLSGLANGGIVAILLGQVVLQVIEKSRGKNFVFLECMYFLGSAVGPGIGSFVPFRVNIFGWKVNEGNSPGIVLAVTWLAFTIAVLLMPPDTWMATGNKKMKVRTELDGKEHKNENVKTNDVNLDQKECSACKNSVFRDQRLFCILFLVFSCHVFSSTTIFFTPILALDHVHLEVIHIQLMYLNAALFTLLMLIGLYLTSEYFEERMLYVIAFFMQFITITCFIYLAFSWDDVTDDQYYILLMTVCLGIQNFGYPFANSIISKITDAQNAAFFQGLSYASSHMARLASRVAISFVFTKLSFMWYCFVMGLLWFFGVTWYAVLYQSLVSNLSMDG